MAENHRRPLPITVLSILLLIFGVFVFVGSVFVWGQCFILRCPEVTDGLLSVQTVRKVRDSWRNRAGAPLRVDSRLWIGNRPSPDAFLDNSSPLPGSGLSFHTASVEGVRGEAQPAVLGRDREASRGTRPADGERRGQMGRRSLRSAIPVPRQGMLHSSHWKRLCHGRERLSKQVAACPGEAPHCSM